MNLQQNTTKKQVKNVFTTFEDIKSKLNRTRKAANGKGFAAQYPAHDDGANSLLLKQQPNGKITINCLSGCDIKSVLAYFDLTEKDLYPNPKPETNSPLNKQNFDSIYDYKDEDGNLLYQICRKNLSDGKKEFAARTVSEKNKYHYSLQNVRRVLYRLPELLAAKTSKPVFLCEGEKDADNLSALGLTATTNVFGASEWRKDYNEFLRERRVVICVDHDQAGIKRGEKLIRELIAVDCQIQIFDPFKDQPIAEKHGQDVSDWLQLGNNASDIFALLDGLEIYEANRIGAAAIEPEAKKDNVSSHSKIFRQILDALQPVNFRDKAGLSANQKLSQKHLLVICIDELLEAVKAQNFHLARQNDFIFCFNGAFWKEINKDQMEDFLGKAAQKMGVNEFEAKHYDFRKKLFWQFLASAYLEPLEPETGKVLINLQNGTFEISGKYQALRAFKAKDFLTYQLGFAYDASAVCPNFKKYLNEVLPETELQNVLAEFCGYVFTQGNKQEKALLLYGTGGNGKSVFFDVINALLGRENITNYSLSDLLQEHNRAQISNKLLNYGSEINASSTKDVFKNLVSNEPIQARLKFGNSFTMDNYAKLAFNCNELPKEIEHSDAYFRRLLIVPFRLTMPEAKQDKFLAQRIIENELSGVFNWILQGLNRLLANGKFTQSDIIKDEIEAYRKESDSVSCFLEEENYQPSVDFLPLKNVFASYRTYCQENGFSAAGRKLFTSRLKHLKIKVERQNFGMATYLERT